MTQGRGNKANDLLQTDFRRANAPAQRNARAGDPSPLDSQRAHLFDEHGLKIVLGSTARPVFTREEFDGFMSAYEACRR